MNETPEERERRLAELSERTKLEQRLKRVESAELKRQSPRVQRLAAERDRWSGLAGYLEDQLTSTVDDLEDQTDLDVDDRPTDLSVDDSVLPRTNEAMRSAAAALRELAAAIGVEISSDWVAESSD
jgi:hypothetical protein